MTNDVLIRDGAIYLPCHLAETYFRGIDSVIVLIQQGELMVMPVHQMTSGGCLLKIRNASGDRVVQARDVFQDQGLLDFETSGLSMIWVSEKGALCGQLR